MASTSLEELIRDRAWVSQVRAEVEEDMDPEFRALSSTQSVIQLAVRLTNVALDYHVAGVKAGVHASQSEGEGAIGPHVDVAQALGRELTGLAPFIGRAERVAATGIAGTLLFRSVDYVAKRCANDPFFGAFLSAAFMTWGIFYDKLELDQPEPDEPL